MNRSVVITGHNRIRTPTTHLQHALLFALCDNMFKTNIGLFIAQEHKATLIYLYNTSFAL